MVVNAKKLFHSFRLIKKVYKGYTKELIYLIILGILGGIAGGVGIGSLIPLFSLVTKQSTNVTLDKITLLIEKSLAFVHLEISLPVLLIMMLALFLIKGLTIFLATYVNSKAAAKYEGDLRRKLLKKTLGARWSFLIDQKIGYLEKMIMNDSYTCASVLTFASDIVLRITNLIMYIFVALSISTSITLFTLLAGIILFFSFKPIFSRTRQLARKVALMDKETSHFINENMIGIKTIKSFNVEEQVLERGEVFFKKLKANRIRQILYNTIPGSSFEPIGLIFISIMFAISYKTPGFNIASFAVTIYLVQKIFTFIQNIQSRMHGLNELVPYLQLTTGYQDAVLQNKEIDQGTLPFVLNDKIEFKNVGFSYDGNQEILSNVNFFINKGEVVGLIGPSGAGKTTIVDLLLNLFKPQKGSILIDNVNIEAISLKSWREKVGFVSQDIFLLNDTVENNIRFYKPFISLDEIMEAAKMANIHEFVEGLPNGYKTLVGERGIKLSGGQRQRIVLARALVRKPNFLILDEATSALDNESEFLIQKTMENLKSRITILIIAHRLSTIMNADRVVVLERGEITENGKPEELLKDENSYFYKVYNIKDKS